MPPGEKKGMNVMHLRAKRMRHWLAALACGALALPAAPALAQETAPPAASAQPSESAMVNLVRLLIEQGVLTAEKGEALMAQAQAEAQIARAAPAGEMPAPAAGAIRVPYVPETVRQQIRDELRAEVMQQAKAQAWASPDTAAPDWTRRIRLSGDVRLRSASSFFSRNNSTLGPNIVDYARLNAIGPVSLDGAPFFPLLNSTVDRKNRLQLRARLGIEAQVANGIRVAAQLATGDDNSPISTNQSLGGGFGKRDLWLQHAYIDLEPIAQAGLTLGRMPNPFFSTNLLFDEDLAFDGVAARLNSGTMLGEDVRLTLRGGAFPLAFGDANLLQFSDTKEDFPSRWLLSGQAQLDAKIGGIEVRTAAAYHDFRKLQAQLSDICDIYSVPSEFRSRVRCSTDNQRATFLRKGNSVFAIRDIFLLGPEAPTSGPRSPQYFGLLFDYRVLDLNAQVRFPVTSEIGATASGNYLRNLGYKKRDTCRYFGQGDIDHGPLNNVEGSDLLRPVCDPASTNRFVGGNEGFQASLAVGHDKLGKRGSWQAEFGYRYLESDAVPDAFTDSDFHLGGTNAKGYFVGGKYSLFDGLTLGARWLSANEITGDPYAIDVLFVDLEAKF